MSTYTVRVNALMFEQILSTNFVMKYLYGDQFREFVCGYWALRVISIKLSLLYLRFVTQSGRNLGLMVLDEFH